MITNKILISILMIINSQVALATTRNCARIISDHINALTISDGTNPVYMGEQQYDLQYDSIRFQNHSITFIRRSGERFPQDTHTYVMTLHGPGGGDSTPLSFVRNIQNYMGTITSSSGKPGYSLKKIIEYLGKARGVEYDIGNVSSFGDTLTPMKGIVAESFPIPGHGFGLNYKDFNSLEDVILLYKGLLEQMRQELPRDAKIVLHGRSAGASIAAELAYRYPGVVDKLVLMSMPYPEQSVSQQSLNNLQKLIEEEQLVIDWDWVAWSKRLLSSSQWQSLENPLRFSNTDVMVITGQSDREMLATERELYSDLAAQNVVIYRDFEGVGHEVTKTDYRNNTDKKRGAKIFAEVLNFILK